MTASGWGDSAVIISVLHVVNRGGHDKTGR
jgi:hypothetical protein